MDFDDAPDEAEFRTELAALAGRPRRRRHDPRRPGRARRRAERVALGALRRGLHRAVVPRSSTAVTDSHRSTRRSSTTSSAAPARRPSKASATCRTPSGSSAPKSSGATCCPGCSRARCAGARASASRTPGPTSPASRRAPTRRRTRRRAVFRVNGRKIWTSFAAAADWCFLLCRTEPDAPKHKGISVLLVPMSTPGVEARPIVERRRATASSPRCPSTTPTCPPRHLLGERGSGVDDREPAPRVRTRSERRQLDRPARRSTCARSRTRCATARSPTRRRHAPRLGEAYAELRALQVKVQRSLSERVHGAPPRRGGLHRQAADDPRRPDDRPRGHGPARRRPCSTRDSSGTSTCGRAPSRSSAARSRSSATSSPSACSASRAPEGRVRGQTTS